MGDIKILKSVLEEKILGATNVVIVPHNSIDFDAIGAALGVALVAKKFKKPYCILVNDPIYKIDHGVQLIIDDARKETPIINKEKYLQLKKEDDLFVMVDVNKSNLICVNDKLVSSQTIIIDHHEEDHLTVEAAAKYIDVTSSSASEIVTKLLCMHKIKPGVEVANALLAGIYLDTNKLTKNVSPETMKIIAKLLEMGANMNKVTDLFTEDFISDRRVQELVSKAKILTYSIAIVSAEYTTEYTKEELAKVADYLLKYKVDAAFAIGNIGDNIISISARAKEKINVGCVMQNLGGGGNRHSAATKMENVSISEAATKLQRFIQPPCYIE